MRPQTASRQSPSKAAAAAAAAAGGAKARPATAHHTRPHAVGGGTTVTAAAATSAAAAAGGEVGPMGRPKTASVKRLGSTTAYMAGANMWGSREKQRVRPATASIAKSTRKVIKVRDTSHLKSAKPAFSSKGATHLHAARDGYIYPSSRPASGHGRAALYCSCG